jgi:hypothetical protein
MDAMITISDNDATLALLKLLSDRRDLPAMHAELHKLGLDTLQVTDTELSNGRARHWRPGKINMTSMDTARLLWLIDGGSGQLWTRPDGGTVSASLLSDSSRAYLKSLLADQAYHEALSTSSLCGAADTQPGIPARVPGRWINPDDGTETVHSLEYGPTGFVYGQDVRPCNGAAEVVFASKTGWTHNFGSNAGIVHSLAGKPERHYIISFIANLGGRYADPVFASDEEHPCDARAICYTQRIAGLAHQVDSYLTSAP